MNASNSLSLPGRIKAISSNVMRLLGEISHLATLELQLSGINLAYAIFFIILVLIFGITIWFSVMVLGGYGLFKLGLSFLLTNCIILVINLICLFLAICGIKSFAARMSLQETKKQISEVFQLIKEKESEKS